MKAPKNAKTGTNESAFKELTSLFFETRQIIRSQIPHKGKKDPNEWLRLEVLRFLGKKEAPTMQMIARHLHVEAPSATSLVATLDRSGLIERRAGTNDRRVTRIYLTKKGMTILRKYEKHSSTIMAHVFHGLSAHDVSTLEAILRRVIESHRIK